MRQIWFLALDFHFALVIEKVLVIGYILALPPPFLKGDYA